MNTFPSKLIELSKRLPSPIYAVGGFVRNGLMGFDNTDIDITSALTPTEICAYAEGLFVCDMTYNTFGSVLLIDKEAKTAYEYTTFREDSYLTSSHSPTNVSFTDDINKDAFRRDFTVNAVYQNILTGEITDPLGGVNDIERKILRYCNGTQTFREDGLRIMRLARIAAELGFTLDEETFAAAKENIALLNGITAERKAAELNRIIIADTKYPISDKYAHYNGIVLLDKLEVLEKLFPELMVCKSCVQRADRHKYDVFNHILETFKFADKSVRMAALLHDVGKPPCRVDNGNCYLHAKYSANIVEKRLGASGLKYPTAYVSEVRDLCAYHMVDKDGEMSRRKVLTFMVHNLPLIPKLILLKRADAAGTGMNEGETKPVARWQMLYDELMSSSLPKSVRDLKVNGRDVIAEIGSENRRYIGLILDKLLIKTVCGDIENEKVAQMKAIKGIFKGIAKDKV